MTMIKKSNSLYCLFFTLLCFSVSNSVVAELSQANAKITSTPKQLEALADSLYWLKLGHYRSGFASAWQSEVDDPLFFLAKNGKTDPLAELTSTINAFNGVNLSAQELLEVRCKFPARYRWLKEKTQNNWPELNCPEIEKWQKILDPESITLVFPTAFMNSPSSMFGHTLLRVDAKDKTRGKDLMAFAVNFAGEPDETDNAAMYALKGIFGQYPGNFTLMPYYLKVREYGDIESRDIWEYKLDFNKHEVDLILLHLWELQQATFDYYFVDENCSYQLLSLLQMAREDLDLTSRFSFHVIPSDTVAALRDEQLLTPPKYRPAVGTRLFHYSEQMSDEELDVVKQLMLTGEFEQKKVSQENFSHEGYSVEQQAAILEMAYEWMHFDFNDQGLSRAEHARQLKQLLHKRSKLKIKTPFSQPKAPKSPENGHGSSRLGASFVYGGHDDQNKSALQLSYRIAYHDLLDQSAGFVPGAKISFLDTAMRIDEDANYSLQHLYLIDAVSLAPDNRIFDSWSWNMRIGYDRQPGLAEQEGRYSLQSGYGKSFGNPNTIQAYILASSEINGGDITKHVKIGLGSEFGAIWQISAQHKASISVNAIRLFDASVDYHNQAKASWHWAINNDWGLRSEVHYKKWHTSTTEARLTSYFYF